MAGNRTVLIDVVSVLAIAERIRVRMRPPLGPRIGHLSTISGPIVRHPDRTVEVAYENAATLIALGWTKIEEHYVGAGAIELGKRRGPVGHHGGLEALFA